MGEIQLFAQQIQLQQNKNNIDYFSYFLFFTGIVRFAIFLLIFFRNNYLIHTIDFNKNKLAENLYKRILLYWVIFGSFITLLTSYNVDNKQLVLVTLVLNVIGCCYHGSEHFIYKLSLKEEFLTLLIFLLPTTIWTSCRLFTLMMK